jgi:hypothetical protein
MRNVVRFSVIILLLMSFVGCENEPITDIAKIEKELKIVVKDHGITKCSVVVRDNSSNAIIEFSNTDFIVNNGCLIVFGTNYAGTKYEKRYNLLYLSTYEFSGNFMYLYFANVYK